MPVDFGISASLSGLLANRPAPDPNYIGRFYLATDVGGGVLYRDNGSNWAYAGGRPYRVYTALLTQAGTNAPVATVLENTLGFTPVWSRYSAGDYKGTYVGGFPTARTTVLCQSNYAAKILAQCTFDFFVELFVYGPNAVADDLLNNTPVEIRVYS